MIFINYVSLESRTVCGKTLARTSKYEKQYQYLYSLLRDERSILEIYNTILDQHGLKQKLIMYYGRQAKRIIASFMDKVADFDHQVASLEYFVAWIERDQSRISNQHGIDNNNLRIMTVHGAKGLQAPIVILADTTTVHDSNDDIVIDDKLLFWVPKSNHGSGLYKSLLEKQKSKQYSEYLRLLYVAMTRAEDQLYVAGWENQKISPRCWYNIIRSTMLDSLKCDITDEGLVIFSQGEEQIKATDNIAGIVRSSVVDKIVLPQHIQQPLPTESNANTIILSRQDSEPDYCNQKGIAMHRLMQFINHNKHNDANIIKLLATYTLTEQERKHIIHKIDSIRHNLLLNFIFSDQGLNEVSFVHNEVHGIIDRVLIYDNVIKIIDYKSDSIVPKKISEIHKKYLKQMRYYVEQCVRYLLNTV